MAYTPPTVTAAGLVVATYQDILADNLQAYLNIYGQNQYVGKDSAIYQLLSILSLKQSDDNLGLQLVYNQSSPQMAVGAGLDRAVKMNGLARAAFSYSTAILTLTGAAGTPIVNGYAQDQVGNLWALPTSVTLVGGTATVTATCTTPGNITDEHDTINIIATPVSGWATVTNAVAAVAGSPVEADSQLRARQSISVALPSLTPLASTVAAVLAVSGVARVAPGYPTPGGPGSSIENPTGAVDSWGNPAHSVSMAVEGGTNVDVATAIYSKKTIGCASNGTTSVPITDANTGYIEVINFYRPTYVPIYVDIAIHGYSTTPTSAIQTSVQAAIVAYLNELSIGETVPISAVSYVAMAVNASLPSPAFGVQSLTMGTTASPAGTVDVAMPTFYSVAQGTTANITVSVV
jgi:uncharacterized phage protein gp47/JayE